MANQANTNHIRETSMRDLSLISITAKVFLFTLIDTKWIPNYQFTVDCLKANVLGTQVFVCKFYCLLSDVIVNLSQRF